LISSRRMHAFTIIEAFNPIDHNEFGSYRQMLCMADDQAAAFCC
jgi:hypothetical protein